MMAKEASALKEPLESEINADKTAVLTPVTMTFIVADDLDVRLKPITTLTVLLILGIN
jgi:hypothetical protein